MNYGPSREEVEAEMRAHLAEQGCQECGERDPDKLSQYMPLHPQCTAVQVPALGPILCDDCAEERGTYREEVLESATAKRESMLGENRKTPVAVVFYDCGAHYVVEKEPLVEMVIKGWDSNDDPIYEEQVVENPLFPRMAEVQTECRCGAHMDEIVDLREDV